MSSKRYKNKACPYCGQQGVSSTADHVLCRKFFAVEDRANLPIVPACEPCNNAKSELELYACTVMPFAATHPAASEVLTNDVVGRLMNNQKLRRILSASFEYKYFYSAEHGWQIGAALDYDNEKITNLFTYIVKGLAFHYWGLVFDDEHTVGAAHFAQGGEQIFERMLQSQGVADRQTGNWGNGVFKFEGVRAAGHPTFTVWRMNLLGAEVSGGQRAKGARLTNVYGFTVPRGMPVNLPAVDAPNAVDRCAELGT